MPGKDWDEDESDDSSSEESSSPAPVVRRGKFDDEEEAAGEVLESWSDAEDSEVEREKAKKAEAAKKKADEEAKANHKSKTERLRERIQERKRLKDDDDDSSDEEEEETEAQRRDRQRQMEKDADLKNAEDLFGGEVGMISSTSRKSTLAGSAVPIDPKDPSKTVDIASLALLNPITKAQFENLRNILAPIVANNSKKAHYTLFMVEFVKQLAKDLPSDQIKKISTGLATLSNEKMKEEKAADKTTKKTKAAKSKSTLAISRPTATDTKAYDDAAFGDDDFM